MGGGWLIFFRRNVLQMPKFTQKKLPGIFKNNQFPAQKYIIKN